MLDEEGELIRAVFVESGMEVNYDVYLEAMCI